MKFLKALRLLLDVYGALFLLIMLFGAVVYGFLPHKTFAELGAFGFYIVFGAGFVLWLAALGFMRERSPASPQNTTERQQ